MQIKEMSLQELRPYEKNPRKNDAAVEKVANSIKTFGFKVPLVIDTENVIVYAEGEHSCMTARGIQKVGTVTKTISSHGAFKENKVREEFLRTIEKRRN